MVVIGSSVRLSVCPSVCLSVSNSVPLSNSAIFKVWGDDTVTKLGL